MEHERGRKIERESEEHRLYMTETRQVLENGVWENGERMPQNSRRILMGYLEKPWLNVEAFLIFATNSAGIGSPVLLCIKKLLITSSVANHRSKS